MRNISQTILILSIVIVLFGTILAPLNAQGAGLVPCGGSELKPGSETSIPDDGVPTGFTKISDNFMAEYVEPRCGLCHVFQLGHNIVTFFLFPSAELGNGIGIVPLVAGLLFAVGGIFLLFGAGNPSFYEKGKQTLTAVVIGLLIVYGAWVFINTFLTFIGFVNFTGPGAGWWQISCGI